MVYKNMKVLTNIITLSLILFFFSVPEVLGSEAVAVVSIFCLNNHIRKIIICTYNNNNNILSYYINFRDIDIIILFRVLLRSCMENLLS